MAEFAEFFAFWQMGGYAFYVWTSYGVVALVLAYHYIAPVQRRKKLLRALAARADDASSVPSESAP